MLSPFKTLGAVVCLVFALCFAVPNAHADTIEQFTISFSGMNAPTAAAGTVLTYDATTQEFTTPSFMLTFQSIVYTMDLDHPQAGNPPTGDTISWIANPSAHIFIQDLSTISTLYISSTLTPSDAVLNNHGAVILTAVVATPEPSSLALMLSGVGLVFGMRKRWGLSRAS